MNYDSWKLETPEDEAYRKMGKVYCFDCDRRASYEYGRFNTVYLCEDCYAQRIEDEREAREQDDDAE
jgi:hypothetical protein